MISKWQPIKTAPKDGTVVDLYCWIQTSLPNKPLKMRYFRSINCYWSKFYECWVSQEEDGVIDYEEDEEVEATEVTHWMPLPEPPEVIK